jgi:hypothetical protein
MTDPNLTAIALVLDRSGSMHQIRSDAEGAVNAFVKEQQAQPGEATFTLAQFDDQYELVHLNVPIGDVPPVTLMPRGATALADAAGKTIAQLGAHLAQTEEHKRPGKVLVAIVTDGLENASREWTEESVFHAITEHRNVYGWEFVWLAASEAAVQAGMRYGVPRHSTDIFAATAVGTRVMGQKMSNYTSTYRSTGTGSFDADDIEGEE